MVTDIDGNEIPAYNGYTVADLDSSCYLCSSGRNEELLLLCDGRCGRGAHTYCVGISDIPEGEWFCPFCAIRQRRAAERRRRAAMIHDALDDAAAPPDRASIQRAVTCAVCLEPAASLPSHPCGGGCGRMTHDSCGNDGSGGVWRCSDCSPAALGRRARPRRRTRGPGAVVTVDDDSDVEHVEAVVDSGRTAAVRRGRRGGRAAASGSGHTAANQRRARTRAGATERAAPLRRRAVIPVESDSEVEAEYVRSSSSDSRATGSSLDGFIVPDDEVEEDEDGDFEADADADVEVVTPSASVPAGGQAPRRLGSYGGEARRPLSQSDSVGYAVFRNTPVGKPAKRPFLSNVVSVSPSASPTSTLTGRPSVGSSSPSTSAQPKRPLWSTQPLPKRAGSGSTPTPLPSSQNSRETPSLASGDVAPRAASSVLSLPSRSTKTPQRGTTAGGGATSASPAGARPTLTQTGQPVVVGALLDALERDRNRALSGPLLSSQSAVSNVVMMQLSPAVLPLELQVSERRSGREWAVRLWVLLHTCTPPGSRGFDGYCDCGDVSERTATAWPECSAA